MWDFSIFMGAEAWVALLTLTAMEIVLGIDNIVFISVLADPWVNAITISEWLVNHDSVLELYVDDSELAKILEQLLV